MKTKRLLSCFFGALLAINLSACGGGSSGGGGSSSATTTATGTTATISGSALTTASGKPGQNGPAGHYAPLPNATITMSKISPDGTKTAVDIGTVTSDSTGAFSIPNVTIPVTGTGASTDYYYEVKATDGVNSVTYPVAPTGNTTIAMTPATTLAANILSSVVDNPNSATNPTPSAAVINKAADMVKQNVISLSGKTTLSGTASSASAVAASASGVAAAGGNAESSYKALQFGSEFSGFSAAPASVATTTAQAYLARIARESCGSAASPLSLLAAEALAGKLKAQTTYTATEVLNAFNAVSTTQAAASKITDYGALISGISGASALSGLQNIAYLTQRALTTVDATTALSADQALSFLLYLGSGSGNLCAVNPLKTAQMVYALTSSTLLASPAIMNYEVYNDTTAACTSPQTHFAAGKVGVYLPTTSALSVTGVTVSATGFNGGSPLALTLNGNSYGTTMNSTVCVTRDTSMTYTITATLSDSSTVTKQVTRQHNIVPEPPTLTMGGASVSGAEATPTTTTDKRPIFAWTPPGTLLSQITGAPAGSHVKYTYEFSHYKKGSGSPINPTTTDCPGVNTSGERKLYEVSTFIPASDCQPTTCAATQNTTADQVECRMYINSWLVDENDKLLGQAAGSFRYFCPDSNADGQCD